MTVESRVLYSNGEFSLSMPTRDARDQAREFGGVVIAVFDPSSVAELASIQRLALAAEGGEVDARQACGEIATRLGYLRAA